MQIIHIFPLQKYMDHEQNTSQNSNIPTDNSSKPITISTLPGSLVQIVKQMDQNQSDFEEISSGVEQVRVNLEQILFKLQELRYQKPGTKVDFKIEDIYGIVHMAKNIFASQSTLLELQAPIQVCGDIHGQYYDLLRLFQYGGSPPSSTYLFLGDYVDRGQYGIETICLLYCLKIKYPKHIYLLRGNHQSYCISKQYGFYAECKKRYNTKIWKCFLSSFVFLPVAALINDRIICMHGGLSPEMYEYQQISQIVRPQQVPEQGLLCDLLWADPTTQQNGWADSERGCSYIFGSDVTYSFLKANDLDLVCRAHQVVEDGYEFCHKKRVVTLFSAPNYCGEFDNSGAIMKISEDLECSFIILKPENKMKPFKNVKPNEQTHEQ